MGFAVLATLFPSVAAAQYDCSSDDPALWPPPSRPYFMLAVDTSGSMTGCTNPASAGYPDSCPAGAVANSCGWRPTRYNDAKCALLQTVLAFAGEVNFGLATYATNLDNCPNGACQPDCTGNTCNNERWGCDRSNLPGAGNTCGPGSNASREGAMIRVGMLQDDFWSLGPPPASNVPLMLDWMDLQCGNDNELYASGGTPLNGILRDMYHYFDQGWSDPFPGGAFFPSPLDAMDRACRDVNVILITDGDETCDTGNPPGPFDSWAEDAADQLFGTGVTKGGKTWKIRTHVINFAGGTQSETDAIAAAGNGISATASDEVELAIELAGIIASAVQPETCNNGDDNCNGCTDEGYKKYCNVGQACCSWADAAGRDLCLANYEASVISNPPNGDLDELPCTTVAEQGDPTLWLCYNPGDICDDQDNNCQAGVDEGQLKCGNPAYCPSAEVCDGIDNDCNGQIDDGAGCTPCSSSPEICDGCDNDCDGIVDNDTFPDQTCGVPNPPSCLGARTCAPPQAAPFQGGCVAGAGYGNCSTGGVAETCDGTDENCNGLIDDGLTFGNACIPSGHPAGLVYDDTNPFSACQKGVEQCDGANGVICVGGKGPSTEVCDGIDNDCDGFADATDPEGVFGVGLECGINNPPCSPGQTECINGALVCVGGNPPLDEVCDGVDNDCDGGIDEAPLFDAPLPGFTGCWTIAGNTCSHGNYGWDPPPGQTDCYGLGTLQQPCATGALQCNAGAWLCSPDIQPAPEVCDGIDNNCNGLADDGTLPQVGASCGPDTLPCVPGALVCMAGLLVCNGGNQGGPEICNNIDDDCNGSIDDGIPNMGACAAPYDVNDYPGDRSNPPCQQGQLECNGMGNFVCVGGLGPQSEVCDGLDNDCDGLVDETGAQPDGLDGTANQFPPPNASIGEACGEAIGACAPGTYQCNNGLFQCFGGQGPIIETCDCEDNDCDGDEDEAPSSGEPPLCSQGKNCIKGSDFCQCASPCSSGEYPCPPGQICEEVSVQGSGGVTGFYCLLDYALICGDCETKTVTDGNGDVVCAPAGTDPPGCEETPECTCRLQSGCREPCFDVTCSDGKICSNFGPNPGTCVDDICYQTGCPGCNTGCHEAVCVDNPCVPGACAPGEMCTPNADWTGPVCTESCADVTCPGGQKCEAGDCVAFCDPACAGGQVCDPSTQLCVDSQCQDDTCLTGAYCDPITGMCGDFPCAGVLCPDAQSCVDGECALDEVDPGTGGSGGDGTGGASSTSSGQGGASKSKAVFGLPTGGGGCLCEVGAPRRGGWQWLSLAGVGWLLTRRRRRDSRSAERRTA